jgi:phosphopentomutase
MAGSFLNKTNSKQKQKLGSNNEKIAESIHSFAPEPKNTQKTTSGFRGILGLNQKVELNKSTSKESWGQEFFHGLNHLVNEEKVLLDNKQKEIQKAIEDIRQEIKKLYQSGQILDREIEKTVFQPIIESSEYQLNFLIRLKNIIIGFRQNISEASIWLESFHSKKKKKNAFWSKVKSKTGGEQYLNSGEHSASRSIN